MSRRPRHLLEVLLGVEVVLRLRLTLGVDRDLRPVDLALPHYLHLDAVELLPLSQVDHQLTPDDLSWREGLSCLLQLNTELLETHVEQWRIRQGVRGGVVLSNIINRYCPWRRGTTEG